MTPEDQFRLLVGMSVVDGELQSSEEVILLRAAQQLGIEREEGHRIVQDILGGGRVSQLAPPSDPLERDRLFKLLVKMAAADHEVTPQELGVLQSLGLQQ